MFTVEVEGGRAEVSCLGGMALPTWLTEEGARAVVDLEPLSLPPEEFARRRDAARTELQRRGLAGLLVYRPSSVEYLSGHHTVNPYPQPLLLTAEDARLYVPDIELARALTSSTASTIRVLVTGSVGGVAESSSRLVVDDAAAALGPGARLAVDFNDPRMPAQVIALLRGAGVDVEDADGLLERQRLILSAAEIEKLERAAAVTQRGIEAAVAAAAEADATDSSVAAAIAAATTETTNSSAAVFPIVATGARGGVHHSTWAGVPLDSSTFCEFAGSYGRYNAPVMITIATRPPNALERRLEGLAQAMLAGVLEEARPGRAACEVWEAVAARVGSLEASDAFHWNFGYSVGLAHPPTWADTAEWSILPDNREELRAGMAFHVPGSFRNFGRGMVGLSHTVVIEESGARALTGLEARILRVE